MPGLGLSALTLAVPRNTDLQALPASTGVGFIPLIRAVKIGSQRFYLVALINPDSFASFQRLVVEQAYSDTLWRWMIAIRWFSLAALVTMAFLLLMTLALQRSLRAREAAQGALQHQLGFVARLLDVSPPPVATIDTAGCYVTVNRAWEDFMGQPRELVIGMSNHAFMSPALVDLHARQDVQLWQSGGTVR